MSLWWLERFQSSYRGLASPTCVVPSVLPLCLSSVKGLFNDMKLTKATCTHILTCTKFHSKILESTSHTAPPSWGCDSRANVSWGLLEWELLLTWVIFWYGNIFSLVNNDLLALILSFSVGDSHYKVTLVSRMTLSDKTTRAYNSLWLIPNSECIFMIT